MSVKASAAFDSLADGDGMTRAFGEMAKFVLARMLIKYVADDFVAPPWPTSITPRYARIKAALGRPPVGDLMLNGTLVNEAISRAPARIVVDGMSASTSLNLPYAAAQQYGYRPNNLTARPYIRFDDHKDDLIADLSKEFKAIMEAAI